MSEAVDDGPLLTLQNPADVVGETVFDCWPSVLPVSIPLSELSPGTVAEARESISFQPSEETGKYIMDMDTNEITISRIVGIEWNEPGTDLEDAVTDLDLAKVMLDVSVMSSMIAPLEELEVTPPSRAAEYAAPATPVLETVLESLAFSAGRRCTGWNRAVAAALRLHHDASLIMTNVQVMSQFVTSLNRTASEVMRTVYAREPFPTDVVHFVTPGRRVRRAAHYMAAMGLWRPTSAPVFPVPSRFPPATPAWPARTAFQLTTSRAVLRNVYALRIDL